MALKRKRAEHENHERWLVSYADFITLLFAFFVVMFASSQTDRAKAKQVSDSVRDALEHGGFTSSVREILGGTVNDLGKGNARMRGPGGSQSALREAAPPPDPAMQLLPSMRYLSGALEDQIRLGTLELRLEPRGLVVSLRQAAFFPSGGDAIEPETYPTLAKIAQALEGLPNRVRLEGHTDAVPIHTPRFRSNWELSVARSIAMLNLLSQRFGISSDRFAIAGYADTVPVSSNETPEGRARNRRVDLVILSQQGMTIEPVKHPDTPGFNAASRDHS